MARKTISSKVVALGVLLAFTVTVYFTWRANQDFKTATSVEYHTIAKTNR